VRRLSRICKKLAAARAKTGSQPIDGASPRLCYSGFRSRYAEDSHMTVSKVIELSSSSSKGIEDAVQLGLQKVSKTVKNIKSAWVNEIRAITGEDGSVIEWRVNMRINFVVD
jgi:flavin-binding protein dodecin